MKNKLIKAVTLATLVGISPTASTENPTKKSRLEFNIEKNFQKYYENVKPFEKYFPLVEDKKTHAPKLEFKKQILVEENKGKKLIDILTDSEKENYSPIPTKGNIFKTFDVEVYIDIAHYPLMEKMVKTKLLQQACSYSLFLAYHNNADALSLDSRILHVVVKTPNETYFKMIMYLDDIGLYKHKTKKPKPEPQNIYSSEIGGTI